MAEQPSSRDAVLARIAEYEKLGLFDRDVEDDPPARVLTPEEISYDFSGLGCRIRTELANVAARTYFDGEIRRNRLILDGAEGLAHFRALSGGAVLTCNHFHPYDNYAIYKVLQKDLRKRHQNLWKVIREGNYTNFPGLYGYFFRNCNTLPLSANPAVLKKMLRGTETLLRQGEKVLIYPEQGMWWNYRKPRPLKAGAFLLAVRANVPVLPIFITLRDSTHLDADGYAVQAMTLHFMAPVVSDPTLSEKANMRRMAEMVYGQMKDKYEQVYGIPLTYEEA